jgi:hypothetical protein
MSRTFGALFVLLEFEQGRMEWDVVPGTNAPLEFIYRLGRRYLAGGLEVRHRDRA